LKGQYGDSFAWYAPIEKTDGSITVSEEPIEEPLHGCFASSSKSAGKGGPTSHGDLMLLALVTGALTGVVRRGKARVC
ncbi:MAG: hypothetical protein NTZ09_12535, partial [Candidatus Hydrogenedentes bacterium]|nr:hypothetical protein [Candidatus Hydrogenedentota bacterium]